jgi:hypothetical protein
MFAGWGYVSAAADVFGDGGEVRSGLCATRGHVGFAGVLMEEFAGFVNYALDVSFGCVREGVIPMDGRQVVSGAGAVGELEKSLLGSCLSVGERCCEGESKQEASCVRSILHVIVIGTERVAESCLISGG